jgi:CRISPR-associated protein (TIGR03984 family)
MTPLVPRALHSLVRDVDTQAPFDKTLVTEWGAADGVLLAHFDDGVLWGTLTSGLLRLAHVPRAPRARWLTLLDARVFNQTHELRYWRTSNGGCRGVRVSDEPLDGSTTTEYPHSVEANYVLLGDRTSDSAPAGFVIRRAPGGHEHAAPEGAERIWVRHYFQRDSQTGLLREASHRWLGLKGTS